MAHTYEELKAKTVAELREIARESNHESLQGAMQMNKDHLLPVLCSALGIDAHEHHAARGIDKPGIKGKMRALKKDRDAAVDAHDHDKLHALRRQIHGLNRQIRGHVS